MNGAVGDVLPLAIGIAISPVPVIAAILMLLSPKARATSIGFLLGWVLGIVVAVTAFTVLASILPDEDADAAHPVRGSIQLMLGAGLVFLAFIQWRRRPRSGSDPALPKWMRAIDEVTSVVAFGLGFVLAAVNPKNLLLAMSAGTDLGTADLGTSALIGTIAIFALLAASTVLVPVIGYLAASTRLRAPLDALRGWLARENAVIMAVLLLVLGVSLLGKGLASF